MSKNAALVAESFVNGQYASAGALVSHGDAIYSYALKLASRAADGTITLEPCMSEKPQSKTTAAHMSAVRKAV